MGAVLRQWAERIHGVSDFIDHLVIGTDLWIPLAFMFIVHGYGMFAPAVRSGLGIDAEPVRGNADAVSALYVRIVVMQFTIIIGAWFAMLAGDTIGPLLLLVLLKTLVDIFYGRIIAGMRQSGTSSGSNPPALAIDSRGPDAIGAEGAASRGSRHFLPFWPPLRMPTMAQSHLYDTFARAAGVRAW